MTSSSLKASQTLPNLYQLKSLSLFTHEQVVISRKWGFTKWDTEEYQALRKEGRLQPDGVYCHYYGNHGPFDQWIKIQRKNRGLAH